MAAPVDHQIDAVPMALRASDFHAVKSAMMGYLYSASAKAFGEGNWGGAIKMPGTGYKERQQYVRRGRLHIKGLPPVYRGKPAGFWKWIRSRARSGMDHQAAITEMYEWITKCGGPSLDGYMRHYKPQNLAARERVQKIWEADIAYMNKLVAVGLLIRAGHTFEEANDFLNMHTQHANKLAIFHPQLVDINKHPWVGDMEGGSPVVEFQLNQFHRRDRKGRLVVKTPGGK